jgi:hypothetical protein
VAYDFKNSRWQSDLRTFNAWKPWVERFKDKEGDFYVKQTERMRTWMREIQQRWPQYIKEDEIP